VSYEAFLAGHARIAILRLLHAQPAYEANCAILSDALYELGINLTRDQVRGQVEWLAEQGLVTARDVGRDGGDLVVARATQRGLDCAAGRVAVRGVRRPSP